MKDGRGTLALIDLLGVTGFKNIDRLTRILVSQTGLPRERQTKG